MRRRRGGGACRALAAALLLLSSSPGAGSWAPPPPFAWPFNRKLPQAAPAGCTPASPSDFAAALSRAAAAAAGDGGCPCLALSAGHYDLRGWEAPRCVALHGAGADASVLAPGGPLTLRSGRLADLTVVAPCGGDGVVVGGASRHEGSNATSLQLARVAVREALGCAPPPPPLLTTDAAAAAAAAAAVGIRVHPSSHAALRFQHVLVAGFDVGVSLAGGSRCRTGRITSLWLQDGRHFGVLGAARLPQKEAGPSEVAWSAVGGGDGGAAACGVLLRGVIQQSAALTAPSAPHWGAAAAHLSRPATPRRPRVPRVLHFIFGLEPVDDVTNPFTFAHYLAVASAAAAHADDGRPRLAVLLHYHHAPLPGANPWWEAALRHVTQLVFVADIPTAIGGKPILKRAHAADVVRLEALRVWGGVYLDFDTVTLAPLWDVVGAAPFVAGIEHGAFLSNAVMAAAPGALFLDQWRAAYASFFVPQGWAQASLDLPHALWKQRHGTSGEVHVLPESVFMWPPYDAPHWLWYEGGGSSSGLQDWGAATAAAGSGRSLGGDGRGGVCPPAPFDTSSLRPPRAPGWADDDSGDSSDKGDGSGGPEPADGNERLPAANRTRPACHPGSHARVLHWFRTAAVNYGIDVFTRVNPEYLATSTSLFAAATRHLLPLVEADGAAVAAAGGVTPRPPVVAFPALPPLPPPDAGDGASSSSSFEDIYARNLWADLHGPSASLTKYPAGRRYYSGPGSDPAPSGPYFEAVAALVARVAAAAAASGAAFNATSRLTIVDAACGDARIGMAALARLAGAPGTPPLAYIGFDRVADVIEENQFLYGTGGAPEDATAPLVSFVVGDLLGSGEDAPPLPCGHVLLVRQVLQHFSNADVSTALGRLLAPAANGGCGWAAALVADSVAAACWGADGEPRWEPAGDDPGVTNVDKPTSDQIRQDVGGCGLFIEAPPFGVRGVAEVGRFPVRAGDAHGERLRMVVVEGAGGGL